MPSASEPLPLEAFAITDTPEPLVPASPQREWMDGFTGRHAYRCLPIATGNTYGWQILLSAPVEAAWDGGDGLAAVQVTCGRAWQAVSNFSRGVLTFDVPYLFRTPPGYHLLVTGPSNTFKDGIAPMTAVVETGWLPYTFTMNYQFTRPGAVRWDAGEPYVQVAVLPAGLQEDVQPVIRRLAADPALQAAHDAWRARREASRAGMEAGDPVALKKAGDRDYYIGRYADGTPAPPGHVIKMRLRSPQDQRG